MMFVYYEDLVEIIGPKTKAYRKSKKLKDVPERCLCDGENFCFPGFSTNSTLVFGKKFSCDLLDGLRSNHLLQEDIDTADDNADITNGFWEPVFVTGASSNHFEELRTFIDRLRRIYTKNQVIVYDLGLENDEISEVKSWCNVELKTFNFSVYPEHVANLQTYAFKMIIIDALQTLNAFFYTDTSVAFKSQAHEDLLEAVKFGALQSFATFPYTFHSVGATTHPGMYEYLPVAMEATRMMERVSTAMLVVDSPYTRNVMKWWYLCAMTSACISPEGSTVDCPIHRLRKAPRKYADCHRYDQAFWNLIYLDDLFGQSQHAVTMGFTTPYKQLTDDIVNEVELRLGEHLKPLFKTTVTLHKGAKMKERYSDKPGNCS
ncbi:unnamed protein product [Bursaphelenchus xylophilus]|uniref:(pine wood nematode) hypothetical protein n=1 Tax=Bursaphelenchus xylophilus TaxID=6326 RepID=A0A7I8X7W0_BURXY|nr:unnamed protein product [Bursaphelenchus xylophilus]CAG9126600.1 unnamed protein product [Bursaphelenchus xylophilus]